MKVLILDNYDSFTYNLYQSIGEILQDLYPGSQLEVKRNNELSLSQIKALAYDRIVISPGPGNPGDEAYFGVCKEVLLDVACTVPTLGVCLGLQGIAHYFGGQVIQGQVPMHGKVSRIIHDGRGLFVGIPQTFEAMRYHSLVADDATIPDCLEITARVESKGGRGVIMGLRHTVYPLEGVQFHPESFATTYGKQILANFLRQ